VKSLRIIILVLFSILLPIRGAVAATMLCPEAEGSDRSTMVVDHDGRNVHADHTRHENHPPAHHHADEEESSSDAAAGDHTATCQFCASGCCLASIVGSVPSIAEPSLNASVNFPGFQARVPAFQSNGQERPPRTI
jgi:hypothetical protein